MSAYHVTLHIYASHYCACRQGGGSLAKTVAAATTSHLLQIGDLLQDVCLAVRRLHLPAACQTSTFTTMLVQQHSAL
jgi:hypothetical protein